MIDSNITFITKLTGKYLLGWITEMSWVVSHCTAAFTSMSHSRSPLYNYSRLQNLQSEVLHQRINNVIAQRGICGEDTEKGKQRGGDVNDSRWQL